MRAKFLQVIAESLLLDPALLDQSGVSVIGLPSRAESHVTAGYEIGDHFVVTCDPAVESMLTTATVGMEPTMTAWQDIAVANGGQLLGSSRMQLLGPALPTVDALPDGFAFRRLDRDNAQDLALIARLIEASDADDLDEAEIEIDDLDEIIEVVVDEAGDIVTYSAARPFDMAVEFADIGILTVPEHRGIGLGATAVAALCPRLRSEGLEPLYRCADDNIGSVKLSENLGFEIVTRLVAYRFPT